MNKREVIERIISKESLAPYIKHHGGDYDRAVAHYKCNILIAESFYPLLAVLEKALRNAMAYQLARYFDDENWWENAEFEKKVSRFQLHRISKAKKSILSEKRTLTQGNIVGELSFGFWTSLFDARFEMTLWKGLRLAFPHCPKNMRKRRAISAKFNAVRKLRNRIFHYEAITWNIEALRVYKSQIIEGLSWLDKELLHWVEDLNHVEETIERYSDVISKLK